MALIGATAPGPPGGGAVSSFVKEGMSRYRNPVYQYEVLGLGGTTLRPGPDGFTGSPAGWVSPGGLEYRPYLAYQYWWDQDGHRHYPFVLRAGYGEALDAGEVVGFRHELDIHTGLLTIDLDLRLDGPRGRSLWHSRREEFVTPDGVMVVRVTDGPGAPDAFRLRVEPNRDVHLYHDGGIYATAHAPWVATFVGTAVGLTASATRERACTATLAVEADRAHAVVDAAGGVVAASGAVGSVTCFIAPGSSLEPGEPGEAARRKAATTRAAGFDGCLRQTRAWWTAFYGRSSVELPDPTLSQWYERSLYYHGVYFGRTDVPPGCNGTGPLFSGTVCPEYDLVLSQMALLQTGRFDEARRVAAWISRVLPRAERYATEGLTLHKVSVRYDRGAIYGPLISWDGTIPIPPTEGEGIWAWERYPGANAALMSLAYADWTMDAVALSDALRVLKATTHASVAELEWRSDLNGYAGRRMGNSVQLAAADYGIRESVRRGVAEAEWTKMVGKVVVPTAEYRGARVVVVGPGFSPVEGCGDAPWLSALWWFGGIPASDRRVRATYDMICESMTGRYVFNNGWMAVHAAKLGKGEDAIRWLRNLLRPGETIHDDTCLGEIVYGSDDFKKTPEIGAHGSLICAVSQMLLDPDSDEEIRIFPAIPAGWRARGVAFTGLTVRGGMGVSARLDRSHAEITLENRSGRAAVRDLRVRLPRRWRGAKGAAAGARREGEWLVVEKVALGVGSRSTFVFAPEPAGSRAAPRR